MTRYLAAFIGVLAAVPIGGSWSNQSAVMGEALEAEPSEVLEQAVNLHTTRCTRLPLPTKARFELRSSEDDPNCFGDPPLLRLQRYLSTFEG